MAEEQLPPLRIREADGSPNAIPVFDVILSDNLSLVQRGGGIVALTVTTGGGGSTSTAGLVQSSRTISTIYPLSGGGDLSVDRTHAVDTAFLVNTGRLVSAGVGLSGGGDLSADRTISLVTPVSVSSGGTGASTFTNRGILFGSGGQAIQALAALNSCGLIVGSSTVVAPQILTVAAGSQGYMLTTNSATATGLAWAATGGGGSSVVYAATGNQYVVLAAAGDLTAERVLVAGTGIYLTDLGANSNVLLSVTDKTVRFPMALLTVKVNSGNAFWSASSGTNLDQAYVGFVDSGIGVATYWAMIPNNLSTAPTWGVDLYHSANTGSGGNIVLRLDARVTSGGSTIDSTTTNLVAGTTFGVNTFGVLTVSTMTATNFDSTLAVSNNQLLFLSIQRLANVAGDSVNAQWNLHSAALRLNVL